MRNKSKKVIDSLATMLQNVATHTFEWKIIQIWKTSASSMFIHLDMHRQEKNALKYD